MCMQCGATCLMLLCIQCGSACRAVAKWVKSWDPCVFGTSAGPSLQQQPQQGARGRGGKGSKQGSGKGSDGRPEYKAILLAGPPGACACLQCVCECVFECVCVCVRACHVYVSVLVYSYVCVCTHRMSKAARLMLHALQARGTHGSRMVCHDS